MKGIGDIVVDVVSLTAFGTIVWLASQTGWGSGPGKPAIPGPVAWGDWLFCCAIGFLGMAKLTVDVRTTVKESRGGKHVDAGD
jgi:hypothetical protein